MIDFKNAPTTDYSLYYYSIFALTKIDNYFRKFGPFDSVFEANEIIDNFYIGDVNSSFAYNSLKEKGITNIISVITGFEPPFSDEFNYLVVDALDTENTDISAVFEATNKFLDNIFENNEKVLIHCLRGRSRSATILCAFLIKKFGMKLDKILELMKDKREVIAPNTHFCEQLEKYYRRLYLDEQE